MHAPWIVLAGVALAGAGCHVGLAGVLVGGSLAKGPYEAGSIAAEVGPDAVRTLACLDVGLAISRVGAGALLEMYVGNRCVHAEPFDLQRLVIRAKDASGWARWVSLLDPRHEIGRAHVGALEQGHERIRLDSLDDVAEICFELDAVTPDAPNARPLPLCFERTPEGWRARPTP